MKNLKSKTPTKNSKSQQQKPAQIYQSCLRILAKQTQQQNSKWLIDNKLTTFAIKNEKCLNIINLSTHIFEIMVVQNESSQQYINRLIHYFKGNNKKIYQFCRCLRHFEKKDYQFQYISSVAKMENIQPISFYLKCRMAIIDSFLNKNKKEMLINVNGNQQEWFKVVKKVFKTIKQEQIIELFTDTIKYHYLNIKKNPNEPLNGAQILRICQIMYRQLKSPNKNSDKYYSLDEGAEYGLRTPRNEDDQYQNTHQKQREVKKLFQKNVVDGLQAQDRQLIRILSYKDNNIARMLQKKHEKMIELIADDVQNMRKSIQEEKKKYIELFNEKQQILKVVDGLNFLALSYIGNDSVENEEKLIKAIENFNVRYRNHSESSQQLRKLRENKKNKRLINIIENQEREKW